MGHDHPTTGPTPQLRCGPLLEGDAELIDAATDVVDRSSDGAVHTVAAAVRDGSGRLHVGMNVYHFTGGPCAELVVLGSARAAGGDHLEVIAAVGAGNRGVLSPCGRCRQVLADLHPRLRVIVPTADGVGSVPIRDLLPFGYEQTYERRPR